MFAHTDLLFQTLYTPGSGSGATTSAAGTTLQTSTSRSSAAATTTSSGGGSCSVAKYAQCGGSGYTGCTNCAVSYLYLVMMRGLLTWCLVWLYLPGQRVLLPVFVDGWKR